MPRFYLIKQLIRHTIVKKMDQDLHNSTIDRNIAI